MDFLFGLLAGVVLLGFIWLLVRSIKRWRAKMQAEDNWSDVSRADASVDPIAGRMREETKRKHERYQDLMQAFNDAESIDAYQRLLKTLEQSKSQILEDDYNRLKDSITRTIKELEDEATQAALMAPKLAAFQALKSRPDSTELFEILHRIHFEQDGILTLDELEEHCTQSDTTWFYEKYEVLLVEHLRNLLLAARNGTAADYEAVMELWEDLEDFETTKGEWRDELIEKHLLDEWNQVVVRFIREPDSDDELFGLDELDDDDYRTILEKIRESDDPLSLKVALILLDETSFDQTVVEVFRETLNARIERFHEEIGFKPGESIRST